VGDKRYASAVLTPGKTQCPLWRRLGEPQGMSEWKRKTSPAPELYSWTVQPVAIRYTLRPNTWPASGT